MFSPYVAEILGGHECGFRRNRSTGFAGYVAVCVQLYCRCFTVLHLVSLFTLHVSAYMAIFRCVGCFIFVFLMDSAVRWQQADEHTRKEKQN
jgi:hypothetical protein